MKILLFAIALFSIYAFLQSANKNSFGHRLKQAGFAPDDLTFFFEGKQVQNQPTLIRLLKEFDMRPSEVEKFVKEAHKKTA